MRVLGLGVVIAALLAAGVAPPAVSAAGSRAVPAPDVVTAPPKLPPKPPAGKATRPAGPNP